jgi:hypothetical protein
MLKKLFGRWFKPKPKLVPYRGNNMNHADDYFSTSAWMFGFTIAIWYEKEVYHSFEPWPWPEMQAHHNDFEMVVHNKLSSVRRGLGLENTLNMYMRDFTELYKDVPELVKDDEIEKLHKNIQTIL